MSFILQRPRIVIPVLLSRKDKILRSFLSFPANGNGITILGFTVSSFLIKEITKEHLDLCYDTFYHPSNMGLVVVGDFDENEIMKLIKNSKKASNLFAIFLIFLYIPVLTKNILIFFSIR